VDRRVSEILDALGSSAPEDAWSVFLESYAPLLLQVARLLERDPDSASDCFLYICELLRAKSFRRLRKFDPHGSASFETWLRAVARNLCLDWRRREFGRHRPFKAVERLSAFDQEVFRLIHLEHVSQEDAAEILRDPLVDSRSAIASSLGRISRLLTPRQLWLLSSQHTQLEQLSELEETGREVSEALPSPEEKAIFRQRDQMLMTALARLSPPDRLLLRLRFEQELTLREIAGLAGLKDAQSADRKISEVLQKIRVELGKPSQPGKTRAASV